MPSLTTKGKCRLCGGVVDPKQESYCWSISDGYEHVTCAKCALDKAIAIIARDGKLPVDEALKERNSRRRVSSLPPDPILEDEDFDRAVDNSNRMLFGD